MKALLADSAASRDLFLIGCCVGRQRNPAPGVKPVATVSRDMLAPDVLALASPVSARMDCARHFGPTYSSRMVDFLHAV